MAYKQKSFDFNCEIFSSRDVLDFWKSNGYKVEFDEYGFEIKILFLGFGYPNIEKMKNSKKYGIGNGRGVIVSVLNDSKNKKYWNLSDTKLTNDKKKIAKAQKEYDEWHREAKKLYDATKRKFGLKLKLKTTGDIRKAIAEGKYPMKIKDLEWINEKLGIKPKKWWEVWKK